MTIIAKQKLYKPLGKEHIIMLFNGMMKMHTGDPNIMQQN